MTAKAASRRPPKDNDPFVSESSIGDPVTGDLSKASAGPAAILQASAIYNAVIEAKAHWTFNGT
jgi:hypothetical protein